MPGALRIAVLRERAAGEARVAASAETVRKFVGLGAVVAVETGAGTGASIADADYAGAGAQLGSAADVVAGADIVLCVQGPEPDLMHGAAAGAWIVGALAPFAERARIDAYAAAGFEACRTSRAIWRSSPAPMLMAAPFR